MREYGSDFHSCAINFIGSSNCFETFGDIRYYACGRHAIDAIIAQEGWKRIWIPAYFCYTVIEHICKADIEIMLYDDYPLIDNDEEIVRKLPYKAGDVLLRINYFGLRRKRTNIGINVPVIEDHSHGLITDWSSYSEADWCIASLRKSLPIAAGGILWSPKGHQLPADICTSKACEEMANMRYEAMRLKTDYLRSGGDKDIFREKYIDSENQIDQLSLSGMDLESQSIIRAMDIKLWMRQKTDNWLSAIRWLDNRFYILGKDGEKDECPFSIVLLTESARERECLRRYLILHNVYPAILWQIPQSCHFKQAKDFSERMLSIHCDARYSRDDIKQLCKIINGYYDTNI